MGTLIHVNDLGLMNCIAREVNKLAGMYCYYYRMDKENTTRKAVYDEVDDPVFLDMPNGLKMPVFGTKPAHSITTSDEGRRKQWDGEVWVARADWEILTPKSPDGALYEAGTERILGPRTGDVFFAWGDYFDVVDVSRDGVVDDDQRIHTLYKMSYRLIAKFEAWRRTETP